MLERGNVSHQELSSFIDQAEKAGYATGDFSNWKKEEDGSTIIAYESGPWRFEDNFFGGEPFGGREVIFFNNKPYWLMVYYGRTEEHIDSDRVYTFLRKVLSHISRPPLERVDVGHMKRPVVTVNDEETDSHYVKTWEGGLTYFKGEEEIIMNDETAYKGWFAGGLVDRK